MRILSNKALCRDELGFEPMFTEECTVLQATNKCWQRQFTHPVFKSNHFPALKQLKITTPLPRLAKNNHMHAQQTQFN